MRYQFAIDIDRPVETVWEFSNDFFNAPRLGGQAIVFRHTSPGGPGLGATYEGRMMILGFETRVHGSFTEWEPLRAMTALVLPEGEGDSATSAGRDARRAGLPGAIPAGP